MIKFHICTVKKHRFLKLPNCQCYFDYQQSILSEISEVIFLSKKMFSALDNEEQTAHSAFPLTSIIPDNKSLTNDLDTIFKRCYLFIFRERGREGERKGEKHQCVVASHVLPSGDLACNPGMCPDWELNQWPFSMPADTQSTEPQQPGHKHFNKSFHFLLNRN